MRPKNLPKLPKGHYWQQNSTKTRLTVRKSKGKVDPDAALVYDFNTGKITNRNPNYTYDPKTQQSIKTKKE